MDPAVASVSESGARGFADLGRWAGIVGVVAVGGYLAYKSIEAQNNHTHFQDEELVLEAQ